MQEILRLAKVHGTVTHVATFQDTYQKNQGYDGGIVATTYTLPVGVLPAAYHGFESCDVCVNEDGTEVMEIDIDYSVSQMN